MLISDVKIGMKVRYIDSLSGACRNGIVKGFFVKSYHGEDDTVYVAYPRDDEWENYRDYPAALTYIQDLRPGWKEA